MLTSMPSNSEYDIFGSEENLEENKTENNDDIKKY